MNIRLSMKLNLVILLTDCKFFDNQYKVEYDDLIYNTTEEVISLNLEYNLNNKYFIAVANIYQGLLLKKQNLIYIGILLLKDLAHKNCQSINKLIDIYLKRYIVNLIDELLEQYNVSVSNVLQ